MESEVQPSHKKWQVIRDKAEFVVYFKRALNIYL